MTKESGLGAEHYVDGVRLSSDIGSFGTIQGGMIAPLGVTGINQLAHERIGGKRTGSMNLTTWFNPTVGASHKTYSTLPTADRLQTYLHRPLFGRPAANLIGKQINYDGNRTNDGGFSLDVQSLSNGFGLEWTDQLTAGASIFSGAGAGSGLDYGAAIGTTAFGLQAYMQVVAFAGTSATVAVQHSDDNGGADPYANVTGGSFAAVSSAPGSQRIQTSRTESIKRWLRINITGTFSNLEIIVMVSKNRVNTVF